MCICWYYIIFHFIYIFYEVLPCDGLNGSKHVAGIMVNKDLSANKKVVSATEVSCTSGCHDVYQDLLSGLMYHSVNE
jgi:hypothetical protein